MSAGNHRIFRASCGGVWGTASDQVSQLQYATLGELQKIAADNDLPKTTRVAADSRARRLARESKTQRKPL